MSGISAASSRPSRLDQRSGAGLGVSLALLVVCGTSGAVAAQPLRTLGPESSCPQCEIVVEPVVSLGDREGVGYVSHPTAVVRLSTGAWLVVHAVEADRITVFDSNGAFMRHVGGPGAGPGEYRWITDLHVGAGDTVRVYDAGLSRLTVLGPELEYISSRPLGIKGPSGMIYREDGSMVVAVDLPVPERRGYPLHIVAPDGRPLRSFGAEAPIDSRTQPHRMWRSITSAQDGGVWSVPLTRYVLERWDAGGNLRDALVRQAPWFEPHEAYIYLGDGPPEPRVVALTRDRDGLLWTLVRIAGDDWQDGIGDRTDPWGREVSGVVDHGAVYDTVIEIIDPAAGALLASRRVADYLVRFAGDGLVVGYREDAIGFPFLDIYRIRLDRR